LDAYIDPPFTAAPAEISLAREGPFYRAQQAVGLIRPNQWNLGRRIAVLTAIGWLPLFLITNTFEPRRSSFPLDELPCPCPVIHCGSCVADRRDSDGLALPRG
jgi:hypothetical protein